MPETLPIDLDVASALALGARERQEDALVTSFSQGTELGFAVLSDGMGGHAAGDLASRIIVTEVFAELTLRGAGPGLDTSKMPGLLRHAVQVANECIEAHVAAHPRTRGMGGTVVATVIEGDRLHWISIGDSPLYLWRDGELSRLNEDHSMGPQIDLMARQGLIDEAAARDHPQRNCLTSALIGEKINAIDCPDQPFQLLPGDLVLAASDGVQYLSDEAIASILRKADKKDSREVAEAILSAISTVGDPEQDNISLVVIRATAKRSKSRQTAPTITPTSVFKAAARVIAPVRQARSRS
ncbi:SpoIIE family protein phosphatase [Rhodobacterales bacterium HKCCE3408]|nr:SpoIIE family protein phosphatase [Rhodobacterales bacterium HKCCE3408]